MQDKVLYLSNMRYYTQPMHRHFRPALIRLLSIVLCALSVGCGFIKRTPGEVFSLYLNQPMPSSVTDLMYDVISGPPDSSAKLYFSLSSNEFAQFISDGDWALMEADSWMYRNFEGHNYTNFALGDLQLPPMSECRLYDGGDHEEGLYTFLLVDGD